MILLDDIELYLTKTVNAGGKLLFLLCHYEKLFSKTLTNADGKKSINNNVDANFVYTVLYITTHLHDVMMPFIVIYRLYGNSWT